MKKTGLLMAVLILTGTAAALNAQIDQSPPQDIVLKPSNGYTVTENYSSTSSTGDIKNREWNMLDTPQTATGVNAQFSYDRDSSSSNVIRLTVSDGTDTKVDEVTQVVHDVPNASITADKEKVTTGETVTFSSTVANSFDSPVTYSWKGDVSGNSSTLQTSFNSAGTKTVKLKVTDSAGYSSTTQPITVQVNSQNDPSNPSGGSGGGGGGGLGALPSQNQKNNQSKTEPQKKQNKTDSSAKERPLSDVKSVVAEARNGVARVNITKSEGVNTINVRVDPASERAGVKSISITAGNASGSVSVSVEDLGRSKPRQVPEEASGKVYSYKRINTSLNDSGIEAAEIDFSVNKSWVEKANGSREEVVMKRFSRDSWNSLETRYVNSTEKLYNFQASSTGFSYYAVALEDQEPGAPRGNQTDTDDSPEETGSGSLPLMILLPLILVAAVIFLYGDKLFGGDRRSELEEELDEIEQDIMDGGLEEADNEELVEQVEEASSLINRGKLEEAEELIEEMKQELE